MSWKLATLAIALFAGIGVGVAVGDSTPQKAGCPCCESMMAASADANAATAVSKTDQELIEKQKTCPVTNQPLGSMGVPVKVRVKGRTVFLCCAGCKKKLLANPDKYLTK